MRTTILTSILTFIGTAASVIVLSMQGARAIELTDFNVQQRAVITKEAPKRYGVILEKVNIIPAEQTPMPRAFKPQTSAICPPLTDVSTIEPAAGGYAPALTKAREPGKLVGVAGPAYDMAIQKFNRPGTASMPVEAPR